MSSPQNKQFNLKLSAPGKVILFGEYSVVFNQPAVAATLCLLTKLHISESNTDVVHLNFSSMQLDKSFALKDVKEYIKNPETNSWEDYLQLLTKAVENLYQKTYGVFDLTDPQKLSLVAFFHSFWKCLESSPGFSLKIDSELCVGSGLGSSASFSVVLCAAALIYEFHHSKKINDIVERDETGYIINKNLKDKISELAYSCEKIFHGSPSGVDHNTILLGSMLKFIKSDSGNEMTTIDTIPIKVLLVNTNVARSTKKLVESFKKLKNNNPEIIDLVLQAMGCVAKNAVKVLSELKTVNSANQLEVQFGDLISINHNLLRVLGASHPSLEKIVTIADGHNLKAKLTGAGGGGFGFVYLPSNVGSTLVKTIEEELSINGFTVSEVTLGGPGLTIEELN